MQCTQWESLDAGVRTCLLYLFQVCDALHCTCPLLSPTEHVFGLYSRCMKPFMDYTCPLLSPTEHVFGLYSRCVTPFLRACNVNLYCTARVFRIVAHCLCDPLFEAASLLFSRIFLNHVQDAQVRTPVRMRMMSTLTAYLTPYATLVP